MADVIKGFARVITGHLVTTSRYEVTPKTAPGEY